MPAGVALRDVTFWSAALGREVTYRRIALVNAKPDFPVRVVYLLHGNGQGYREWSLYSGVAAWAKQGFVLVMPEGHSSYFMNAVAPASDRYENFVTRDLVDNKERGLEPAPREHRAIVGVSMGGFAALVLGMKRPEEYGFVGALSPPVDAAERGFRIQRWEQWLSFRRIFGPMGSASRQADDPFILVRGLDAAQVPFIYLGVGRSESLREPVERFDRALTKWGVKHAMAEEAGGHDWRQWALQMPRLRDALAPK